MISEYALKGFEAAQIGEAAKLWNQILEEGNSFPGDVLLTEEEALNLFREQTETICMMHDTELVGLYTLHPNNIGRCSHIANASYAVKMEFRGKGLGKALVSDSIRRAKKHGFMGLQFNAVVANNYGAITLYLKLGFSIIGTIKNGFRLKDNSYCDTLIFLKSWSTE